MEGFRLEGYGLDGFSIRPQVSGWAKMRRKQRLEIFSDKITADWLEAHIRLTGNPPTGNLQTF